MNKAKNPASLPLDSFVTLSFMQGLLTPGTEAKSQPWKIWQPCREQALKQITAMTTKE